MFRAPIATSHVVFPSTSADLKGNPRLIARRRATILALIGALELIEIDAIVLDRAARPLPTELGTLDAIHLASALLWRDSVGIDPVMATRIGAIGLAAQAHGPKVLGT